MKVNTLIDDARESNRHPAGSHPLNKVRDGRRKKSALSGIGISLIAVSLSGPAAAGTFLGNTGPMYPGQQQTGGWNYAIATSAYFVDVSPKGAGLTTPCQFEVIRVWTKQVQNPGGALEREIWYTVKNVGSNTCSADKYLFRIP
jgi:hypothetical protein